MLHYSVLKTEVFSQNTRGVKSWY